MSLVVAAALLVSCGGGSNDSDGSNVPAAVAVYLLLGSVQCFGGGTTAGKLQQQLIDAGVEVIVARCGLDGVPRRALCGESDGRIAMFDVAEAHAVLALALGFALLSTLPGHTVTDCS